MAFLIRMFTDTGAHHVLWTAVGAPWPASAKSEAYSDLERLPITAELRGLIEGWARDWESIDSVDAVELDYLVDFDRRGLRLSRRLQRELGTEYEIEYHFTHADLSERLFREVLREECPGWSCH